MSRKGGAGRGGRSLRSTLRVTAAGALVAAAAAAAVYFGWYRAPDNTTAAAGALADAPTFVGSSVCGSCHTAEFKDWQGSHHQLAMQPATPASVAADFGGVKVVDGGATTEFSRDGDRFMVRTTGADGKLHDYPIKYTFGVYPLQQYLIEQPGGRLQAFGIAWDSRPRAAGGQHWFALNPGASADPSSPLHWTGIDQTWNFRCAGCHSTDVRKQYDPQTRSYATTFSEVSVGCEACHGPGSAHVAWARNPAGFAGTNRGLTIALDERDGVTWQHDPATGEPRRSKPRTGERELQMCARCHALSAPIHEDFVHDQPLGNDYRVALLDETNYFSDGQIKGEVYEYGSFIQSHMFKAGVTCSDCHRPHTATLRAQGNALCTRCHLAKRYDSVEHFHHPVGSVGAQCVSCHMPNRTYMRVDVRHDHSFRVPRPDLSVALGTPNACNACHADKTPQWAVDSIESWHKSVGGGLQQFARAIEAGRVGAPGAEAHLRKLFEDRDQPAIARATALTLLARLGVSVDAGLIGAAADSNSPLIRRAAAQLLPGAYPAASLPAMHSLLEDPVRAVRIAAAESLAAAKDVTSTRELAAAYSAAAADYVNARQLNADRPEAHLSLADFFARRGERGRVEPELLTALSLDPTFTPAAVNLADLYRARGRDDEAETVLRTALQRSPDDADVRFAFGLLQVRQRHKAAALDSFAAAVRLAPSNPRYAYVYAIALNDAGKSAAAVDVLERSVERNPYHRQSLAALAALSARAGDQVKALKYKRRLKQLEQPPVAGSYCPLPSQQQSDAAVDGGYCPLP